MCMVVLPTCLFVQQVYAMLANASKSQTRLSDSSGTGVKDGCWESKPGPLDRQPALLKHRTICPAPDRLNFDLWPFKRESLQKCILCILFAHILKKISEVT